MIERVVESCQGVWRACFVALVLGRAWFRAATGRGSSADEVYDAVVRLGSTAIKLAQVASTRPDLVPPAVSRKLESLQETAPRFPFADARDVVERELGASIGTLFSTFPDEPVASASLSQVYFATLRDGSDVAVKVQRPGIAQRIQRDVRILGALAWLATRLRPGLRNLRLVEAAAEFRRWTLRELDFQLEARNADEFRQNFKAWPDIHFPGIHWQHTSRRVLTMERVGGRRVKDTLVSLGADARLALVRRIADMVMKMFVDDGFFHADLHPGNIFFSADGRIVLLDVGMVGRMNPDRAGRFLAYWMAVGRGQRDRAFHHLLGLASRADGGDLAGYRTAYESILDEFDGSTVVEKSLARTYMDVVLSGARHGIVFPSEMLLQAKALVTMEALCIAMAPGLRFSEEMRPIVARRLAQRADPKAISDRLWAILPDLVAAGEWFYAETSSRQRPAEPAFRRDAVVAIARVWIDATDAWLESQRNARFPTTKDRPHLAALLDVVARLGGLAAPVDAYAQCEDPTDQPDRRIDTTPQARWAAFRRANRGGATTAFRGGAASWRRDSPRIDASPAALLPLLRVVLARIDAAVEERMDRPEVDATSRHRNLRMSPASHATRAP